MNKPTPLRYTAMSRLPSHHSRLSLAWRPVRFPSLLPSPSIRESGEYTIHCGNRYVRLTVPIIVRCTGMSALLPSLLSPPSEER
jgi:hypothetical protein